MGDYDKPLTPEDRLQMKDCPACARCRAENGNFCRMCGKQLRDPIILLVPEDRRVPE